jgi:2-(1,2-epoxy-1,2-dihydrophenyl)acetyl-CoA isomerase
VDYKLITVDVSDGVAVLTFNRPERMNALNQPILAEINDALPRLRADDDVKALILTGAGRGFCAGADLGGGGAEGAMNAPEAGRRLRLVPFLGFGQFAQNLLQFGKPTIAAINGACVGAGLAFASGCDMRIASQDAKLSAIFVQRALVPDCGLTYWLPRIVGLQKALDIAMTGRIFPADEALAMGLVNKVVPADQVMEVAMEQARAFAKGPSIAIELARQGMYRGLHNDLASCLEYEQFAQTLAQNSDDVKEGATAFFEKRDPVFRGR